MRLLVPEDVELRMQRLELTIWAFLLSLSFYPDYFGWLAWFALVRPLMIISKLKGRPAFNAAFFFSFIFCLFEMYWIALVTPPGMVGAVLLITTYYSIALTLFNRLYRYRPALGMVAMPFLWVSVEYFRTLTEFCFPWSALGYSQSYYLYPLQIVSIISVHGLSLLIVTVNILIWLVFRNTLTIERRITSAIVALSIPLLLTLYGWAVVPQYPMPGRVEVALLQGSIPINVKWATGNEAYSYNRYDSLTRAVADSSIRLYVWPESSAPCYLSHAPLCRRAIGDIVQRSNSYHLVGALGAYIKDGKQRQTNSCYQFAPSGALEQRYDKVKLVPFSEHVPYQDYLFFLEKSYLRKYMSFLETYDVQWWSDFYPGDSALLFHLPEYSYSALICYEAAFPDFVRNTIINGADFIVGITNDTWFGDSHGTYSHSRIFLTRAVENRCWGVRVANSGLSYIVDGYGRIRNSLEPDVAAALRGGVNPIDGYSVFTRVGDVAGRFSLLITVSIISIFVSIWIARKTLLRKPA